MKKVVRKPLTLQTETVRVLQELQVRTAAGGMPQASTTGYCTNCANKTTKTDVDC